MKKIFLSSLILSSLVGQAHDISFNKDVLPILSDKCYACHGPDAHDIKGKLQLHTFENAATERHYTSKSGKKKILDPAIIPGKPDESLVWERIISDDEDEVMPPHKHHKPLSKKDKEIIRQWIASGAEYEPHWAYTSIKAPKANIDQLVEKKLKEHKLEFNTEADKRTLIRRLSFDLRGLPASPQEIQAFLQDKSPDAWQKLIDQFLASPAFGEKMAVMWLDLVRYADTVGYHGDQIQHVEAYRDYVIKAFNQNMPFDQFTKEQLAGDLLPNPTQDQLVASAYNRLNMMSREGGAQENEYLAKYAQDRVATTSIAWMGSTLACAECHDHKYDPFTAKDFYSFAAFFSDIQQVGVYNRNPSAPGGLSNNDPFPPYITLNQPEIDAALNPIKADLAKSEAIVKKHHDAMKFDSAEQEKLNTLFTVHADAQIDTNKITLPVKFDKATGQIAFEFPKSDKAIPKLKALSVTKDGKAITFKNADASHSHGGYHPHFLIHKNPQGWKANHKQMQVLVITPHHNLEGDYQINLEFEKAPGIKVKVSSYTGCFYTGKHLKALRSGKVNEKKKTLLYLSNAEYRTHEGKVGQLKNKLKSTENNTREICQITVAVKPRPMRLLPKGNWQDNSGEIVEPAVPSFLGKINKEGRATRLDLAEWLTSSNNPLTSRALANRLWKQFFGRGLAADVTDLGAQGQAPENPELLDYLATQLKSNWDIKATIKSIVSSRAYRQSSNAKDELKKQDPFNDYLARQQSRRLDAEFLRDNLLEISSLLVHNQGGNAVKPYQPVGYYKDLNFPRRVYKADKNDQQYRRGVYMHRQRTFLHPMLKAFDAPSREQCVAARSVSNTPLQALNLLNDPSFVEAAKNFAQSTITLFENKNMRLNWMFEKATGRTPDNTELLQLQNIADSEIAYYSNKPKEASELLSTGLKTVDSKLDQKELAAWTSVARIMLNLHETITVY
ncbi:PSD1 and planctomycete cytochrome C domain-containing protein [Lentisphaera marina]|uniref:PSD1 and planctomycete cytochrome C domain-containing protein n=1 Tax=Lentisphaera marina TaxID=1111041 RepID=UPI002367166F|nr:PSD1 and planctomycete cytochrome C domain-containing protein [Lentisphaera marina]MDD7986376.1 PSD1 and planctomycete cytochrome C domain-containing protein [Lentisphaera marina]